MMVEVEVDKVSIISICARKNLLTGGEVIAGMTPKFKTSERRR